MPIPPAISTAQSPRVGKSSSPMRVRKESGNSTLEQVLVEYLYSLKRLVLEANASQHMGLDVNSMTGHIQARAKELVDEDVNSTSSRAVRVHGDGLHVKVVALSETATSLQRELERLIYTDTRMELKRQSEMHRQKENDVKHTNEKYTRELARRDHELAMLKKEKDELERKNLALVEMQGKLKRELEKAVRDQIQTHQFAIELRMQGLDFKSEVNRRSAAVLEAVQTRMGFVPAGIQKQLLLLQIIKVGYHLSICHCLRTNLPYLSLSHVGPWRSFLRCSA